MPAWAAGAANHVTLFKAKSGFFEPSEQDTQDLVSTSSRPPEAGQALDWCIHLQTQVCTVQALAELTFPAAHGT